MKKNPMLAVQPGTPSPSAQPTTAQMQEAARRQTDPIVDPAMAAIAMAIIAAAE